MHSEVAHAVAQAVQVEMTHQEGTRLTRRPPVSPETYDLYLKGMFHLNKFTPEGFSQGLAYLDMAVEKDPTEPWLRSEPTTIGIWRVLNGPTSGLWS